MPFGPPACRVAASAAWRWNPRTRCSDFGTEFSRHRDLFAFLVRQRVGPAPWIGRRIQRCWRARSARRRGHRSLRRRDRCQRNEFSPCGSPPGGKTFWYESQTPACWMTRPVRLRALCLHGVRSYPACRGGVHPVGLAARRLVRLASGTTKKEYRIAGRSRGVLRTKGETPLRCGFGYRLAGDRAQVSGRRCQSQLAGRESTTRGISLSADGADQIAVRRGTVWSPQSVNIRWLVQQTRQMGTVCPSPSRCALPPDSGSMSLD